MSKRHRDIYPWFAELTFVLILVIPPKPLDLITPSQDWQCHGWANRFG